MSRLPPILELAQRPVTTGLAVAAIATTLYWWTGGSIDSLVMTREAIGPEPWRLLTSALPHVGVAHLAFNVYWLLVIGGAIEKECGAVVAIGAVLLTAIGSAALEHALFGGGVGLSGIGYGVFGFAWGAARRELAFQRVVDSQTIQLFVVWFFLCCLTTFLGVMNVANAAHAGGWGLGTLAGIAWAERKQRLLWGAGTLVALVTCVALASPAVRPFVNFSGVEQDLANEAYELVERDPARAIELYRQAIARDDGIANWHYNLGVALDRAERGDDALREFQRAYELDPAEGHRDAFAGSVAARGNRALAAQHYEEALASYRQAVGIAPDHELAGAWRRGIDEVEAYLGPR